ncbi:type I polyketide synthase [Actinokineospora auranticolor]|uniref:Acyl transferase domain-containing protein n=1 Tax=Actinokineospora auranticolor TaxID=155976 RepID=A0A2S6GTF0_9PSEU|nr:type I polyketide synthase [Actinokineospora auranticolor]PPK68490.1 acyl transferase domain-containing protein [Actinokineospora auranticolor]
MTGDQNASDDKLLGYLKKVTADLHRARGELAANHEPIAIVGLACRFPGGARTPEEFWALLADGVDAMTGFPADRGWEPADHVPVGGFLDGVGHFDADFFGISPREALAMDPQQRLLLECSWEALERAGIDPESLRGTATGVFAGTNGQDYPDLLSTAVEGAEVSGHAATGNIASVLSGRVAYALGLEGPAVSVDTACSSSLVALHWAVRSLRAGDCSLALVGGVTVMSTPAVFAEFARQGGLAADGRCKAFSDDADGTAWGEGIGVLVVERLSDARRHGHDVLAVVRGSAVNSDGASNGLTAPNGPSQQRVITRALADAGLSADEVDVVEAHGTGTVLGDPIEAQALLATYGRHRTRPLLLGSVKSNIGHTQAAAGVAGVIKVVLAMRHGSVPATLHVTEPTSRVDWSAGSIDLAATARPWPADRPRRAGVSSFGISGTNAHVILEQPAEPESVADTDPGAVVPWVLSARGPEALTAQAEALAGVSGGVADIGWSLATTRAALPDRAVVVGADLDELRDGLAAPAVRGRAAGEGRVGVLFSGQGAQRPGMGTRLAERFPVFARHFDEIRAHFDPSVRHAMETGDALDDTGRAQPALFAYEVALYRLLESWGLRPEVLIGHSVGEIAAAHVAGVWSLPDACAVVAARARLMAALPAGGAMVAVEATEDEVRPLLTPGVSLAAVNGPRAVVVSGVDSEVEALAARFDGRRTRRLAVSHAFHSPLVEPALAEFARVVRGLDAHAPTLPVVSNLTGAVVGAELTDPDYWVRHARDTVRFADGVRAAVERGVDAFVEIGPRPVLAPAAGALTEVPVVPLARDALTEDRAVLTGAGALWTTGVPIDLTAAFDGLDPRRVPLPTYPFQRERFWPTPAKPATGGRDDRLWELVACEDVPGVAELLGTDVDQPVDGLPGLVSVLGSWRRGVHEASVVRSCRYDVRWVSLRPEPATPRGLWAVLREDSPVADALRAGGAEVVEIGIGAGVDRADLAGRVSAALGDRLGELTGVACLPGWDDDGDAAVGALWELVVVTQGLADLGVDAPLWCLTRAGVAVGAGDTVDSPVAAGLWGLGRVIGLERGAAWGGLVDLPTDPSDGAWARAAAVITGGAVGEREIAVRASGSFGRRLVPHRDTGETRTGPDLTGATVLVTGGTGALGRRAADWLAGHGVARVALLGRGADTAELDPLRARLAERGATLETHVCDVADRGRLAEVVATLRASGPPLRGVLHAAGVVANGLVVDLAWEEFVDVVRAKVIGGWNLHDLAGEVDLFVCFSSIAGVWGSGAQAAYAAGNAFLDGLACYRAGLGLPATSVAWGPWEGGGMVAGAELVQELHRRGLARIAPGVAFAALDRITAGGEPCAVVADVDWSRLAPAFAAAGMARAFAEIPAARDVEPTPSDTPVAGLAAVLRPLPEVERDRVLLDLVAEHGALVLGHRDRGRLDVDRPFRDLGFDSLTAVELRNRLVAAAGVSLPASVVFDFPTPRALAVDLRTRLVGDAVLPATEVGPVLVDDDPVVIVGMACRLPGGVSTPDELWTLVADGVDGIGPAPTDRGWRLAAEGGFVADADRFDAAFFGISPREALAMDPQQRLVLENTWEALENAGIDPVSLRHSDTGVFVGVTYSGYQAAVEASAEEAARGYGLTGSAPSVVSGRVAYVLGLEGPAVSVDTACSSSLVALHWAAQALRRGECSLALAGGVTVMATPGAFVEFGRQGGLAPDGRCKAFSADADGTGWSEGVGFVVVERLSDARRRGHEVLAILRGSAVNSDGASNGLTAPNGPSQERVITRALADAGLTPSEVDSVEAHGTGTRLGDPIEAQALLATYGQNRDHPLWLGSVKSNLGHTQAAAGVAGVIKTIQSLRHGLLPKTLHTPTPTTHVDWSQGHVALLTEPRDWPDTGRPRRAAVSAFGISGTNAHVILEQGATPTHLPASSSTPASAPASAATPASASAPIPTSASAPTPVPASTPAQDRADVRTERVRPAQEPSEPARAEAGPERSRRVGEGDAGGVESPRPGQAEPIDAARPRLPRRSRGRGAAEAPHTPWVFSARDPRALAALAARLAAPAATAPVAGVGRALATARTGLPVRAVVLGDDRDSLLDGLRAVADGRRAAGVVTGTAPADPGPLAAVFVGQGAQRPGMGRDLHRRHPVFADAFDEVCAQFDLLLDHPLREVVFGGDRLDRTAHTQAALFAHGVALWRLAESFGARADYLIGHSVGELTAAYLAGVWSLPDACALIAARGGLMQALPAGGAMVAVEAAEDEVLPLLRGRTGQVGIAAVNAPESIVLSGDEDAVLDIAAALASGGRRTRRLPVSHAFHSPRMDAMVADFARVAAGVTYHAPRVPLVSNLTGALVDDEHIRSLQYWVSHVRQPVRFADGIGHLLTRGVRRFVEVGPDTVLASAVHRTAEDRGETARVSTLQRAGRPEDAGLLAGLGALYTDGTPIDWTAVVGDAHPVPLPTYPFQRERFWLTPFAQPVSDQVGDHAYEITWEPLTRHPAQDPPARWLVVAGESDELASRLVSVLPDAELVSEWDGSGASGGVLVLPGSVAELAALARSAASGPVWCLTRDAVDADGVEVDPAAAALWGLGRVAALEYPRSWGGLVDVTGPVTDDVLAAVRDIVSGVYGEDQIALRGNEVLGRRLVRANISTVDWKPTGTVLVTGGTGGLGAAVARWAAANGAAHLLLLSRSGESAAPELRVELAALGATATFAACDVADRDALAAALATVPVDHPLTAVVHTAGVGQSCPLESMDDTELHRVLTAKVRGAENLHELTGDLDAFVLFSSIAATWGSGGQAGYAAANAHLDGLAARRAALGLPATAIAWGPWDGAGLAVAEGRADQLARRGLPLMDPALALAGMARLVGSGTPTTTFAEVDWTRFAPPFTALRPSTLFDALPETRPDSAVRLDPPSRAALLDLVRTEAARVVDGDPADPVVQLEADGRAAILELVRAETAQALGLACPDATEPASDLESSSRAAILALVRVEAMRAANDHPAGRDASADPVARLAPAARTAILDLVCAEVASLLGLAVPEAHPVEPTVRFGPASRAAVLDLVRVEAARVLGFGGPVDVPATRALKDLGFDSLTAVELRDALTSATGVALPATLVFDHPTPTALADHLFRLLDGIAVSGLLGDLDRVGAALADLSATDRLAVERRLRGLVAAVTGQAVEEGPADLSEASDDDLFDLLDGEFGR